MLLSLDAVGVYVLTLTLAALLVLVLLLRTKVQAGGVPLWLAAGILGALLGGALSVAAANIMGFTVVRPVDNEDPSAAASPPPSGPVSSGPPGGMMGGGAMGGGPGMMGGGPGGGMGMMGGGGGGGGGPSPKRQLTSLVRKLELLTGDIAITLSPEQAHQVVAIVGDLQSRPTLTDEEAQPIYDELLAVLNEEQISKQEAIGLPFRRGGGGGGGGSPGGPSPPDANPFAEGEAAEAVASLATRIGDSGPSAETTSEPPASDPRTAEPHPPQPDDEEAPAHRPPDSA
jgi:hypothetical protein